MSIPPTIEYNIDANSNPSTWPGPKLGSGHIATHKVDVIYTNINTASDFRTIRTGTNKSIDYAVAQVTKHIARGVYRVVSLNANEYSCVVVISTEKSSGELVGKNGFPWDEKEDPQPEVLLN